MKSVGHGYVKHCMSEQFLYVEFWLRPKSGVTTLPSSKARQVVIEVPRRLIEDWKRENPDLNVAETTIAADIARVVALDAMSSLPTTVEYEIDVPKFIDERHLVMNERPCDHHDNGIRAWVVKSSDLETAVRSSSETENR